MSDSRRVTAWSNQADVLWLALAILSSVGLATYFVIRFTLGPLNFDEVYFAHVSWLVRQGLEPYRDFYTNHLPAYFWLVSWLPGSADPSDLGFLSTIRALNAGIALAYCGLLFALDRKRAIYALPILIFLLAIGRMVEVRSDTIGLLLFNCAWLLILRNSRRSIGPALLVTAALLFSARAAVMAAGFGILLLILLYRHRDRRAFLALLTVGGAALVTAAGTYALAPELVTLMVQSVFLDPAERFQHVSFVQRLAGPDRAPIVLLVLAALTISGARLFRTPSDDRALIICGATLTQLLLVLFDPSPFTYVYCWAAIPTIAGLMQVEGLWVARAKPYLALLGFGLACALGSLIGAYLLIKKHPPPTGSLLRVSIDQTIPAAFLHRTPTDKLIQLMLSGARQHSLANQLAIREEVCRRLHQPVLSTWAYHPVCLRDSTYYWYEIRWPGVIAGTLPGNTGSFDRLFRNSPPSVFIWGGQDQPNRLNPWARQLLAGYRVHPTFAVRDDVSQ